MQISGHHNSPKRNSKLGIWWNQELREYPALSQNEGRHSAKNTNNRFTNTYFHKKLIYLHKMPIDMSKKAINRLKAVLAEQGKTNKWLAEQLDKNETTISRWCTNEIQPSMDNFVTVAKLLGVDVRELINSTKTFK